MKSGFLIAGIMPFGCLFLACMLNITTAPGQWYQQNVTGYDLYAVQYLNNNTIICAGAALVKTQNGGSSWSVLDLKDQNGADIIGSIFLDVHFFDANTGVATGSVYLSNTECIFRTTNGGASWTLVSSNNDGDWPRRLDDMDFPSSTVGYAVGSNGRILKTQNGGTSWTPQSSGVNWHLHSVDFVSVTTGFAVGDGGILRTTNGGTTWTKVYQNTSYWKDIAMWDASNGFAISDNGPVVRTTDGGNTWLQIVSISSAEAVTLFSASDIMVLTSSGAIRSESGGTYWEYYQYPGAVWFHNASFAGNKGCVVGDDGNLWLLDNRGGPAWPVASFNLKGSSALCPYVPVEFENQSNPAYSFTWMRQGQILGNDFELSYAFPEQDRIDSMLLVAYNGFHTDTAVWVGYIREEPAPYPFAPTSGNQNYCVGTPIQITVPGPSNFETVYQLYAGQSPVGAGQTGNGSALYYTWNPGDPGVSLFVRAVRTTECGTDSLDVPVPVFYHPVPDLNIPFSVSDNNICAGEAIDITLNDIQPGLYYGLTTDGMAGDITLPDSGGPMVFSDNHPVDTVIYGIKVLDPESWCFFDLDQTELVAVRPTPEAYFTFPTLNPEIGQTIVPLDNSVSLSGSYRWLVTSAQGSQEIQGTSPPTFIFDQPGSYQVALILTSPDGCSDTLTRMLHVPVPAQPGTECRATQLVFGAGFIIPNASAIDHEDNLVMMIKADYTPEIRFYSGRGDTLGASYPFSFNRYRHLLVKINPQGVPQWMTYVEHESVFADVTAVKADSDGNIYAAYYHSDAFSNVDIYSTDGRRHPLTPGGSELSAAIVLLKYDKYGRLIWNTTMPDWYATDNIDIELDSQGNILLMGAIGISKLDQNGQILWTVPWDWNTREFADIVTGAGGEIYSVDNYHLTVRKITPEGVMSVLFGPATYFDDPGLSDAITADAIRLDEEGNIYVCGNFYGGVIINGVWYSDPLFNDDEPDPFVMKLKNDGTLDWFNRLVFEGSQPKGKGFDVRGGKVGYYSYCSAGTSITAAGQLPVSLSGPGHFLWTLDTDGDNENVQIIHQHQQQPCETLIPYDVFHFHPNTGDISMLYDIHESEQWGDQVYYPLDFEFPGCNQLLTRGGNDCFSIPEVSVAGPAEEHLKIRPNPASGIVFMDLEASPEYLEIANPSGVVLYNIQNPGKHFDTSRLANGFYTVKAVLDGKWHAARLIVIH